MRIAHAAVEPGQGHAVGRQLLAQLYREETGCDLPQICVTSRGKPYFPQGDWHFSITHTPSHVFCALSRRPVGIDAEEVGRNINLQLANKILSPEEAAQFRQAENPSAALLTFWVLKEAAAKLTGDGLRGYPNHTAFRLDDPRVSLQHGCLLAVVEEL